MASRVSFLQANLQHSKAASFVLGRACDLEKIDVAFIQEPWISGNGRISGLGNCSGKILSHSTGTKPRACLLIRSNIKSFLLTGFCTSDVVTAQVTIPVGENSVELTICSAYFPGDQGADQLPPTVVRDLITYCRRNNRQLIIGCDANAHHLDWGSTDTNERGEYLYDYIIREGLLINNVGSEPTFANCIRAEVLDLTICSQFISSKIVNWRVSTEPSCSDHRHIRFELVAGTRPVVRYRDPQSTDWRGYLLSLQDHLKDSISTIKNRAEIEAASEKLGSAILSAYQENCPLKEKRDHRGTPWWSGSLDKMRKGVRILFNRAKSTGHWDEYRKALTEYNKRIRKAKRESWRRFCQSISDIPASVRIHKILARDSNREIGSVKRPDGSYTNSIRQTLELLVQNHFPGSSIMEDPLPPHLPMVLSTRPSSEDWDLAKRVFTPESVKWAINSFSPFKSPGEDGIFPALLQRGEDILVPPLTKLLRASVAWGHIPRGWLTARVVYIRKVGVVDNALPKSFRPISLTSFVLKTLERILDQHIRDKILRHYPLSPHQYAYQVGKSTDLALNNLVGRIKQSLNQGEFALAAFLDIEGAFNNALPRSLYSSIERRGVHRIICNWIRNMLENRRLTTSLQGETVEFRAARGCPQGGVLSPLLWSLLVDSLLNDLSLKGFVFQCYADDLVIVVRGAHGEIISDIMQTALNLVANWCEVEQLSVNPRKTVVIPFTKRRKLDKLRQPIMYGETIPFAEEVKYLGVILDRKLTWNSHLKKTIDKARLSLWNLRRICGRSWGMAPKQIYWIYETVIKPMVKYGAVVWWTKTLQATAGARLTKLQRQACLAITGAMSTTPTLAMETILNMTPIHICLEWEARIVTHRLLSLENQTNGERVWDHAGLLREFRNHHTLSMISDVIPTEISMHKPFKVLFPKREEWMEGKISFPGASIALYTDGSRNPNGVGVGVFCRRPRIEVSINLGRYATIYQAEVYALVLCARELIDRSTSNKNIYIVSDSQAALKALGSYRITSKLVRNCIESLIVLGTNNRVTLLWVPGHQGVAGNEKADALAKKGAEAGFIGPEPSLGITKSNAKDTIFRWAEVKIRSHWNHADGLTHSKAFIKEPSRNYTKQILEWSRKDLRILTGLLTGHCCLNYHLNKIGLSSSSDCRFCCVEDETAEHILCACPALERKRQAIFGHVQLEPNDFRQVLPFTTISFVKSCGLYDKL